MRVEEVKVEGKQRSELILIGVNLFEELEDGLSEEFLSSKEVCVDHFFRINFQSLSIRLRFGEYGGRNTC